jgi:hypothetical protein
MRSSWQVRAITDRTTLPDGTVLPSAQYGPPIDALLPLGAYVEDHEFVTGSGDLDVHNGRMCVTPEYPSGTYAYFVTIDAQLEPAYPYVIGPSYYGTVQPGNTGPGSGHNDIDESVQLYTGFPYPGQAPTLRVWPLPATDILQVDLGGSTGSVQLTVMDATGSIVTDMVVAAPAVATLDLTGTAAGAMVLRVATDAAARSVPFLVVR